MDIVMEIKDAISAMESYLEDAISAMKFIKGKYLEIINVFGCQIKYGVTIKEVSFITVLGTKWFC